MQLAQLDGDHVPRFLGDWREADSRVAESTGVISSTGILGLEENLVASDAYIAEGKTEKVGSVQFC